MVSQSSIIHLLTRTEYTSNLSLLAATYLRNFIVLIRLRSEDPVRQGSAHSETRDEVGFLELMLDYH